MESGTYSTGAALKAAQWSISPECVHNGTGHASSHALSMVQLLPLLPRNHKIHESVIKKALKQVREHAAHSTVPTGLHKCVLANIARAVDRQFQVVVPAERHKKRNSH